MRRSQGVPKIKKNAQKKPFWVEFLIRGVRKGHIILIWGYAEGYNFDLGVRGYQKVENHCVISFKIIGLFTNNNVPV